MRSTVAVLLVLVLLVAFVAPVFAGPPEPPAFSDVESEVAFMQQYFKVQAAITEMAWSTDKKELLLLLDSAGTKWIYARTMVEATKGWAMLGRVAALVAEQQRYNAARNFGSTPNGVLLATPLYLTCNYTSYPTLHGYMLTCSRTQKYWCQGLHCRGYWQNQ